MQKPLNVFFDIIQGEISTQSLQVGKKQKQNSMVDLLPLSYIAAELEAQMFVKGPNSQEAG